MICGAKREQHEATHDEFKQELHKKYYCQNVP